MSTPALTTQHDDALLRRITRRIVEAVNPERIILFGSRAKGSATEDSDIDLLVLSTRGEPPREQVRFIHGLFPSRDFSMDVFVYTPEAFEQRKALVNHLCFYAHRDGRVIYER